MERYCEGLLHSCAVIILSASGLCDQENSVGGGICDSTKIMNSRMTESIALNQTFGLVMFYFECLEDLDGLRRFYRMYEPKIDEQPPGTPACVCVCVCS